MSDTGDMESNSMYSEDDDELLYNVEINNRFVGGATAHSDSEWQIKQSRKRRRYSTGTGTGSVDISKFHTLSGDDKLAILFEKLVNIEEKIPSFERLQDVMQVTCKKVSRVEKVTDSHERQLKILNYKSVDLEARSRRNNLIFRGLYESSRNDDCIAFVKEFLETELRLDASRITIERAHRLGRKKRYQFSRRPIIAAFNNYADTVRILEYANMLRGSQFSIDRDYPLEIYNARKLLWPRYKELKRNKRERDQVSIRYPAQLVKNNEVIEDAFPEWFEMTKKSRIQSVLSANEPLSQNRPAQRRSRETNSINDGQRFQRNNERQNVPLTSQSGDNNGARPKTGFQPFNYYAESDLGRQTERRTGQRHDDLPWDIPQERQFKPRSDRSGVSSNERTEYRQSRNQQTASALNLRGESERGHVERKQSQQQDISVKRQSVCERQPDYERESNGQREKERQSERVRQSQRQSDIERQSQREPGAKVCQRERQSELRIERTPDKQLVEPGRQSHVLDRVRHLEDQIQETTQRSPDTANMSVNSLLESTGDSDHAFYSQYVQDKSPRKFNGLNLRETPSEQTATIDKRTDLQTKKQVFSSSGEQQDLSVDSAALSINSPDNTNSQDKDRTESTLTDTSQK